MQPCEQVDTGVDIGRNETALTSADPVRPGRVRGRSLTARRLAAVLLVAFAAFLSLPLQARAQTTITLVSNTGKTTIVSTISINAQPFTTGSNSGGYTLTSVVLALGNYIEDLSILVRIVPSTLLNLPDESDSTKIITLTNPASVTGFALNTFTAPANTTLSADTTYHVLVTNADADAAVGVHRTSSNAEDDGAAAGWSIGDTRYWKATLADAWSSSTTAFLRIQINGYANTTTLSTDATLSALALTDNNGAAITLTPMFAPATTTYTAPVASSVDEITIAPTVNDSNAEYEIQDGTGTALTDADVNTTGFQVAFSEGANTIKVEVTAEDDSTPETYTVVVTREMMTTTPTALALSIADASAAENAGHLLFEVTLSRSFQNTVKVDFETTSGGTATEGVDYHARRTYTHVILAGDKTAQMGFALIEDTVNDAGETVKVRLSNARVVDAYGDKIKNLDITTAEATGTITAPSTSTTNVPGLTIGIEDATGDEDDGWLDFKVRLSRKSDDYVCYDFESISGGTATEGTDYLKFPKAMYWMQIGKRVDTPFVRIIDDSIDDDGETVKVKISNARLCDDASQTVSITRAEATGTIRNSDPLPRALMARFGRTAAVHVVEHVEERLAAPREVATVFKVKLGLVDSFPATSYWSASSR